MISATINMKGGRGNNEEFSAREGYKVSRKPPTTNPRIARGMCVGARVMSRDFD